MGTILHLQQLLSSESSRFVFTCRQLYNFAYNVCSAAAFSGLLIVQSMAILPFLAASLYHIASRLQSPLALQARQAARQAITESSSSHIEKNALQLQDGECYIAR